jgi:hypothetical protein
MVPARHIGWRRGGSVFSLGLWKAKRNVISVVIAGGILGLAGKLLFSA